MPSLRTRGLTRRELLRSGTAFGVAAFLVGPSFVSATDAAWALEVENLKPETMATLIQMARDIYPHDRIGDEFYAIAVKGYDAPDKVAMVEAGVALVNAAAAGRGHTDYISIGWEKDRVDILRSVERSSFFQTVRSGLVTGLYNQKAVWPVFGYEGESYSKGGYINRGFDDINWI